MRSKSVVVEGGFSENARTMSQNKCITGEPRARPSQTASLRTRSKMLCWYSGCGQLHQATVSLSGSTGV